MDKFKKKQYFFFVHLSTKMLFCTNLKLFKNIMYYLCCEPCRFDSNNTVSKKETFCTASNHSFKCQGKKSHIPLWLFEIRFDLVE